MKWRWAGHLAKAGDERWSKASTMWVQGPCQEQRETHQKMLTSEVGENCRRVARKEDNKYSF